jgi:hypothetical protein
MRSDPERTNRKLLSDTFVRGLKAAARRPARPLLGHQGARLWRARDRPRREVLRFSLHSSAVLTV